MIALHEEIYHFEVSPDADGKRIDHFLTQCISSMSRNQVQRLIEKGMALVNSRKVRSSYRLRTGDQVDLNIPPPEKITLSPEPIPLDVVYEDDDLLVINKPAGLVVHPAPGHARGTLVNALLNHCPALPGIGGYLRPGIIHRLDKDTSGLLVVSKTDLAHQGLSEQMKNRKIKRRYLALVHGNIREDKGLIDAPLGRDPKNRKKFAVVPDGKKARTYYYTKERFGDYTLLEVELETGRTHQIRVHMAYIGYPVAGDPVYGPRKNPLKLEKHALHAYQLCFMHPRTNEFLSFEVPLPESFEETLIFLRSRRVK